MNNTLMLQSLTFLIGTTAIVYWLAYNTSFLGPYGLPNDNLHLLLLVSVFFFTFLTFQARILRRRRNR